MSILTQTNCISLFRDPKRPQKNNVYGDFYFFRFFQPPMSNLQKNHVKIDVFNEPKYHFDPNQVHSTSFRPHKTPNKQKNSAFVTFFFGRNVSAASNGSKEDEGLPNPFLITHSHTPEYLLPNSVSVPPIGWAEKKKKLIMEFISYDQENISFSSAMTFPCIGWNTGIHRLSIVFHPLLSIIRTPPFDQENISSSSAMTFPCIGWNTDKEEDAAQYRFSFTRPPMP